jgi:signal peptidase I
MELLKTLVVYAILIAALWAAIVFLPRFRSLTVPAGNGEITGAEELKSYPLDVTVTIDRLRQGDVVTYRLGDEADDVVHLAWVAGLPGDQVAVNAQGKLLVNDKPMGQIERAHSAVSGGQLPGCGPLTVPTGHLFVINREGSTDSFGHGPLPMIALRGRVGGL